MANRTSWNQSTAAFLFNTPVSKLSQALEKSCLEFRVSELGDPNITLWSYSYSKRRGGFHSYWTKSIMTPNIRGMIFTTQKMPGFKHHPEEPGCYFSWGFKK